MAGASQAGIFAGAGSASRVGVACQLSVRDSWRFGLRGTGWEARDHAPFFRWHGSTVTFSEWIAYKQRVLKSEPVADRVSQLLPAI